MVLTGNNALKYNIFSIFLLLLLIEHLGIMTAIIFRCSFQCQNNMNLVLFRQREGRVKI